MTTAVLTPTPASRHRFHLLDALRGVAAIFVVYWHVPSYIWLQGTHHNFLAVDFFFCLSGFVVAFAYERRLSESLTYGRFILVRVIRLYPMFVIAALLHLPFFLLNPTLPLVHVPPMHFKLGLFVAAQLVLIPNIGQWPHVALFPVLGPAWSLFFELIANAAFGFIFIFRRRLAVAPVAVGVYLAALAAMSYWAIIHHTIDIGWQGSFRALCGGSARVMLSFSAGVLVHKLWTRGKGRHFPPLISMLIAAVITVLLPILLLTPFGFMTTYRYEWAALAFGFPLLILLGSFCRLPKQTNSVCAFLGDTSYPLYLLHLSLVEFLYLAPVESRLVAHPHLCPVVVPTIIALALVESYFLQKYIDAPIRKFFTRLLQRSSDSSQLFSKPIAALKSS